jgi:hypothetical protein
MTTKNERPADDEYVYYTHPSGKVEEMTRDQAAALAKKQGGIIRTEADLVAPTGTPKR